MQASDYGTIYGFSYHTERHQPNGKDWNEVNPGLGFDRELSESWTLAAGLYRNSLAKTTVFGGARWEPIRTGAAKFGAMAAVATGYNSPVVGALTATVRFSDRIGATFLGVPGSGKYGSILGVNARIMLSK